MSKSWAMLETAGIAAFAILLAASGPGQTAEVKRENACDHEGFVKEFMTALGANDIDKVLDLLEKNAHAPESAQKMREEWKKQFTAMAQAAGKFLGYENAGLKMASSRLCRTYVFAQFERVVLLFNFSFGKLLDEWRLQAWNTSANPADFEALIPLQVVEAGKAPPAIEGLEYAKVIDGHLSAVADGEFDKAMEHIEKHALSPELAKGGREEWKKKLAALYGTMGKCGGHEIVAVRKLSSRVCKIYVVMHFERIAAVFTYQFDKPAADWKITGFHLNAGPDALEKELPLQTAAPAVNGSSMKQ